MARGQPQVRITTQELTILSQRTGKDGWRREALERARYVLLLLVMCAAIVALFTRIFFLGSVSGSLWSPPWRTARCFWGHGGRPLSGGTWCASSPPP